MEPEEVENKGIKNGDLVFVIWKDMQRCGESFRIKSGTGVFMDGTDERMRDRYFRLYPGYNHHVRGDHLHPRGSGATSIFYKIELKYIELLKPAQEVRKVIREIEAREQIEP
jgi:hypothetical protein